MPSTYASLHYHLVFGTSRRQPLILPQWSDSLYAYLGGIVRNLGGFPQGINGMSDHVHLLVGLKPTHRLCDVVRETKKSSSKWIRETHGYREFKWQEGYAGFSVSPTARRAVQAYIANQKAHHRVRTFREEMLSMLGAAEVTFDERYFDG